MYWFLRCFRQYAIFRGRAQRKEYWVFTLFSFLLILIPIIFLFYWGIDLKTNQINKIPLLIFSVFALVSSLILLIPGIAVSVRRLHDTNRSGLWLLIIPIPIVLNIILNISFGKQWTYDINNGELPISFIVSLFLSLIYFLENITLIIWLIEKGTIGENRFGPDPLAKKENEEDSMNEQTGKQTLR